MSDGGVPAAVSDIFERAAFEAMILGLPASVLMRQWGDASVGKVGGRIFALLSGWGTDGVPAISFKCSELAFQMLPELERIRPAPYLARAKWVQVSPGSPLTSAELCAYVAEAHRMIAARLTRRLRVELGLDELVPARPQRY